MTNTYGESLDRIIAEIQCFNDRLAYYQAEVIRRPQDKYKQRQVDFYQEMIPILIELKNQLQATIELIGRTTLLPRDP